MEESRSRTKRPRALDSVGGSRPRPSTVGAGSSRSAHVIDLRQTGAAEAKEPEAKPEPPRRPKLHRRPPAKPAAKPAPVAAEPVEARLEPQVAPAPAAPAAAPTASYSELPPTGRRFWPAFWRFLFLLVILGLIVTGALYLYLNYYHT